MDTFFKEWFKKNKDPLFALIESRGFRATALVILAGGTYFALKHHRNAIKTEESEKNLPGTSSKDKKVAVDLVFFRRLSKILKIVLPSAFCKETFYISILTCLLFARTILSVIIAELAGQNAQFLVSRRWNDMFHGVFRFALITIPAAAVNSGLSYFTNMLSLRIRVRLSEHVHNEYLKGVNFYKAVNLGGQNKIDNADQRVTSDIDKFSTAISELYVNMFKPFLDVILFTQRLGSIIGWQGPLLMYSYFFISAVIKKKIMPSFGKLVAKESELEGYYRTAHQRLIANSEEIAFYDGGKKEKLIIEKALKAIFYHISRVRYLRALIAIFDGLLVKYWASIVGYLVLASPLLLNIAGTETKTSSDLTRDYIRNTQYLTNLAQAVGKLVMVGNKLTTIAGYTHRVSELLEMVKLLDGQGNKPFDIIPEPEFKKEGFGDTSEFLQSWKLRCDQRLASRKSEKRTIEIIGGGKILDGESIKFENVDIVSPDGKLLVTNLSFEVKPGMNVMVTGPNGAGKSSLFRLIGELWPLKSGVLTKPPKEEILFVPQKPYLVLGTLRDQIIYPHTVEQMKARGVSDEDLERLLELVDPSKNIVKAWKWDDERDWFLAFSGGQKQRVAMARVFYHRPKFAILDECTSAVSDEVEDAIYITAKKLGITIFTVSHRAALKRHHEWVLRFDGTGKWEWEPIKKD